MAYHNHHAFYWAVGRDTNRGKLGRARMSGLVKGSVNQDFGHTMTTSVPGKERCEVIEQSSKRGN